MNFKELAIPWPVKQAKSSEILQLTGHYHDLLKERFEPYAFVARVPGYNINVGEMAWGQSKFCQGHFTWNMFGMGF